MTTTTAAELLEAWNADMAAAGRITVHLEDGTKANLSSVYRWNGGIKVEVKWDNPCDSYPFERTFTDGTFTVS